MMKRKYNIKLQELPRLTMLLKGFNTDINNKAPIFEETQMLGRPSPLFFPFLADSAFRSVKRPLVGKDDSEQ
jgi:hypothetical protein